MNKTLLSIALAGIFAAGVATVANAADEHAGKDKCYGIAKAGKNDCKAANGSHSCAGQAKADGDKNDFVLVNKGECKAPGVLNPSAAKM